MSKSGPWGQFIRPQMIHQARGRAMTLLRRPVGARLAPFLLALALLVAAPAQAGEWHAYDATAFTAAQAAGKTVMVAVHANWCPTCRAQQPALASLIDDAAFAGCVAFRVNFDEDKGFLNEHQVRFQSTLLVFKGHNEKGRSIGQVDPGAIRNLFAQGL